MDQQITGYHLDHENHWVAELACGHGQHVRHDPPWMVREWVITPEGRASRLGTNLNCVRCEEMGALVAKAIHQACVDQLITAYEDAGLSGLCGEGRWDVAVASLKNLELQSLVKKVLANQPPP